MLKFLKTVLQMIGTEKLKEIVIFVLEILAKRTDNKVDDRLVEELKVTLGRK